MTYRPGIRDHMASATYPLISRSSGYITKVIQVCVISRLYRAWHGHPFNHDPEETP